MASSRRSPGMKLETDRRTNAVFVARSRSHALVDNARSSLRASPTQRRPLISPPSTCTFAPVMVRRDILVDLLLLYASEDMRIAIIGNSGSGKSTLAQWLAERTGASLLDLDTVAWVPGQIAVPRAPEDAEND